MLSEVFWVAFISSTFAFCLGVCRLCYKSKCKEVDICCIKIIRDVNIEEKQDEFIANNQPQSPSQKDLTSISL